MPSIIGEKIKARSTTSRSLPVSGHIRSGTQVLIKSCEGKNRAQELYKKAASGSISFKDAEKLIIDANDGLRKAFTPRNTRHFNVYAHETEGGQVSVDNIMDRHSEVVDGDDVPRLYRIPVVFPPTPDGVEGFFKSEYSVAVGPVKYRSDYGDDGIRRCVYLKPVDPAAQAGRKKFLRREPSIRKDCEPGSCAEFGAGACKFRGRIHFYIPHVIGSGTFVFETGSVNASEDIFLRLEELQKSVGGVLPNFDPNGNPVFFLTKERKKVTYIEEGVEKSSLQWVPVLQTSLIKSRILYIEEKKRSLLAAPAPVPSANIPANWAGASFGQQLDAPPRQPSHIAQSQETAYGEYVASEDDDGYGSSKVEDVVVSEKRHADLDKPRQSVRSDDAPVVKVNATPPTPTGNPAVEALVAAVNTPEAALHALLDLSDQYQVPIAEYADAKFGPDWDSGETVMSLHKDIAEMFESLGSIESVRMYMPLLTLLNENKIPVKELAFPYFRVFFGGFKKAHVAEAIKHTKELLKSGVDVTLAHMSSKLKKAA